MGSDFPPDIPLIFQCQWLTFQMIGGGRSPAKMRAWAVALRSLAWKLEQAASELEGYEADEVL